MRRWAEHVGEKRRGAYMMWWGYLKEMDLLEDRGVEGRIILEWI
jgi:hypothetical protein